MVANTPAVMGYYARPDIADPLLVGRYYDLRPVLRRFLAGRCLTGSINSATVNPDGISVAADRREPAIQPKLTTWHHAAEPQ